jgi:mono/diheme cytochrome c family protein
MHQLFVSRRSLVLALAVSGSAATLLFARGSHAALNKSLTEASPQYYTEHVKPVFQANCYRCHGGSNHRGGLQLDTRAGLMHGGKDGAVIVPGHPEQSMLIQLIRHEGPAKDPKPMPPKSRLSDADIETVTEWIRAGAAMPADETH